MIREYNVMEIFGEESPQHYDYLHHKRQEHVHKWLDFCMNSGYLDYLINGEKLP